MGIRKTVKKNFKREAKRLRAGAGIANFFVPGLGTVSKEVAKLYDKLGATDKKKFFAAKTKAGKVKVLKSKK